MVKVTVKRHKVTSREKKGETGLSAVQLGDGQLTHPCLLCYDAACWAADCYGALPIRLFKPRSPLSAYCSDVSHS